MKDLYSVYKKNTQNLLIKNKTKTRKWLSYFLKGYSTARNLHRNG